MVECVVNAGKEKGIKIKWSKALDTYKLIDNTKERVKCIKCNYISVLPLYSKLYICSNIIKVVQNPMT